MIASQKVNHRLSCWTASFAVICTGAMLCVPTQVKSQNGVAQRDAETNQPGAAAKVEAGAEQSADIVGRSPPAFVRARPEGQLNRKLILLADSGQLLAEDEPTSDKDPLRSVRVVERATLTFDALEATVDPTKHCIFVGDTKRNVRTGALRVDLKRGAAYTVKATGEAFMTSETGADADPFPGLVLIYPTDEEDCYAIKMAVVKPGNAVTFQTPWAIGPKDEVYALAFFLAVVPGEHRGSYKLAITKMTDATVGRQIWEETIKQLDEDAARSEVDLQRRLQELDQQRPKD